MLATIKLNTDKENFEKKNIFKNKGGNKESENYLLFAKIYNVNI